MIADFSQLLVLNAQLAAAPARAVTGASAVVAKGVHEGAQTARDVFRSQVRELYLPHYADSITAQMTSPVSGEFGPESSHPQGGMGAAIEFGSSNHGPIAHMGPAADQLEESLSDELLDVAVESVF